MHRWPDALVRKYPIEIIYNLALPGGGNTVVCQSISHILATDSTSFPPETTLVMFNITGLDRIDLMVPSDHPDINDLGSWHRVLPFAWVTSGGWIGWKRSGNAKRLIDDLQKNQGWEQVILNNCLNIINFIQRLESQGYRYYFMLMDDQILLDAPEFFVDFVNSKKQQQWITFDEHRSMHSYAKSLGLLESDKFHPSLAGDLEIAKVVDQRIKHHF